MNNFKQLRELNQNIAIEAEGRSKATKKEYVKALNKTFKGIDATEKQIHRSYDR